MCFTVDQLCVQLQTDTCKSVLSDHSMKHQVIYTEHTCHLSGGCYSVIISDSFTAQGHEGHTPSMHQELRSGAVSQSQDATNMSLHAERSGYICSQEKTSFKKILVTFKFQQQQHVDNKCAHIYIYIYMHIWTGLNWYLFHQNHIKTCKTCFSKTR